MSPPIRGPGHSKALQAALSTGVLQVVFFSYLTSDLVAYPLYYHMYTKGKCQLAKHKICN